MPRDVDSSGHDEASDPLNHLPIKPRKRARDGDTPDDKQSDPLLPDPKRRCSEFEPSNSPPGPQAQPPPTPPFSGSPNYDKPRSRQLRARPQARKPSSRASPQSNPKSPKGGLELENFDHDESLARDDKRRCKPSTEQVKGWVDRWIDSDCPSISAVQAAEAIDTLPNFETTDDQMSSTNETSQKSERLNSSSPLFRGVLTANGLCIDEMGDHIPPEVQALVDKYFRKARESPKLEEGEITKVHQNIKEYWHNAEPSLWGIVVEPLFPISTGFASGGDTIWNSEALPRKPSYRYPIPPPKTDRHFGFPTTIASKWDIEELNVADHPCMRPYSQPASENIFPSYLREIKSEARGGTLYAAEGQLASAGAHRVNSWLWVLDQLNPNRERSSADAIVFSDAVTQRQAVAYVHYYNPKDSIFYMSCIDEFYFRTDVQRCRDHVKNAMDWLLNIQQPMIRSALRQLQPIAKNWKKGRVASVAADPDPSEQFDSESQRSGKNMRVV